MPYLIPRPLLLLFLHLLLLPPGSEAAIPEAGRWKFDFYRMDMSYGTYGAIKRTVFGVSVGV